MGYASERRYNAWVVSRTSLVAALFCAACGAHGGGQSAGEAPEPGEETPAEPETEHDRLLRFAKDKRKQCATLVDGIDKSSSGGDDIVKFTDDRRFAEVAKSRRAVAQRVAAIDVSLDELVTRRQAYVDVLENMAAALDDAAAAPNDAQKRKSIERYQKLQEDRQPALDAITEWCNAPVERSDAEHGA